jgi:pantoate kinase
MSDRRFAVHIDHTVEIPIGFGLGSSGAAALSLSYALNDALDIGLSRTQAAQIAHHAEIACKTGLGTVIAEFVGGFEIRKTIGAPGIGTTSKIDLDNYKAIILCLAPISTKSFLATRMSEINGLGDIMLKKLSESKSVQDFLTMSREFAKILGLTTGICKRPIEVLKENGFEASVALFGHTVFTLVPRSLAAEVGNILNEFGGTLLVCNIDNDGARSL